MKQLLPNQVSSSTEISPSNAIFSKLMDDLSGKFPEQKKLLIQEALNNIQLQGVNLNDLSYMGVPLLLAAIGFNQHELFESLIEPGINVNDGYKVYSNEFCETLMKKKLVEVSAYQDLYAQNAFGLTIICNNTLAFQSLLTHAVIDPNKYEGKYPPLFLTVKHNRFEMFKSLFLHKKLDLHQLGECYLYQGKKILSYAILLERYNMVELILESLKQEEINTLLNHNEGTFMSFTPFAKACRTGNFLLVRRLIDYAKCGDILSSSADER